MSQREPTEAEMQAAMQAQLENVRIDEVIVQVAVDLLNLAALRSGMGGPGGPPADFEQAGMGIEAVRGLLAVLEPVHADKLKPVKDALAQVQMHYARNAPARTAPAGGASAPGEGGTAQPKQPEQPSAVKSGRLWVPGT